MAVVGEPVQERRHHPRTLEDLIPLAKRQVGRDQDAAALIAVAEYPKQEEDVGERYARKRMRELGIPSNQVGQPDYAGDGMWRAFDPYTKTGGSNTTGVVVNSGVLNPDLLKRRKGRRIWPKMRLKDRIDAIIAHEYEELRHKGSHTEALLAAAKTKLPISDEARRLNRAMAR